MGLDDVKRVYEKLGKDDPLWAVLTDDEQRHGKWDTEAFFATGREEVDGVFDWLAELEVPVKPGTALDFGCGVGRLTQALAERFDRVTGIDISSTMVAGAERFNRHGDRCRYVVNASDSLESVESESLDFVYSNIALQHSPPRYQERYLREFLRGLKPEGVGVVQLRIGRERRDGSLDEIGYRLFSEAIKPWWKRLRGRPPVQVHVIGEQRVRSAIESAGGRVLATNDTDGRERKSRRSLRFVIRKG